MIKRISLILIASLMCTGCSWFKPKPVEEVTSPDIYVQRIVRQDLLNDGGGILFVPLQAGVDIEANDEQTKTSLSIIQGFNERISSQDRLRVLTWSSAAGADFIIKGHIMELRQPSKLRRWLPGKKMRLLSVKLKMINAENDEIILFYNEQIKSFAKEDDSKALGRRMGEKIADFILSSMEEKEK